MSGSLYGRGPYGVGRYSRVASKNAALALASKSAFAVGVEKITNVSIAMRSASAMRIGAHVMWSAIPAPACEPWTPIEADPCAPFEAISIAPCAPWGPVATCGCPSMIVWPA